MTFVRWVDRIARLGRLGSTIDKVEKATAAALRAAAGRADAPRRAGSAATRAGRAVFAASVGYVQHIDIAALQAWAEEAQARVVVAALPGTFAAPGRALAYVSRPPGGQAAVDVQRVVEAFQIGGDRLFDDDPRFGLVVLSEIAGRALSPAVNDPGTAIDIVGTLVRLFALWSEPPRPKKAAVRRATTASKCPRSRCGTCSTTPSRRLPATAPARSRSRCGCRRRCTRWHRSAIGRWRTPPSTTHGWR